MAVAPAPGPVATVAEPYPYFEAEEAEQASFPPLLESDDDATLERFLKISAPLDKRLNCMFLNGSIEPPILVALSRGAVKCAKLLLDAGALIKGVTCDMGDAHQVAVLIGDDAALALVEAQGLGFAHAAHEAAYRGRVEALQGLSVAELEAEDSLGLNSVHYAVLGGDVAALRLVLARLPAGAAACKSRFRQHGPAHVAVMRDRVDALEVLLASGASLSELDQRQYSLLSLAASMGRVATVRYLLAKRAFDLEARTDNHFTPLMHAVCDMLLDAGANLNAVTPDGRTVLSALIAGCGDVALMRALIKRGATPSPAHACVAIENGSLRCLIALVDEYGVVLDSNPSPICLACLGGHIAVARWLLQRGYPLDAVDERGRNAYTYASSGSSLAAIKWLHRHGLRHGRDAAADAAESDRVEVIELLLSLGVCEIDATFDDGLSLLMVAALCASSSVVDALLRRGASLLHLATNGATVAHQLCAGGLLEPLKRLHALYPSLLQQRDRDGKTVLHYACMKPRGAPVVRWLLQEVRLGASPAANRDLTPLMVAAEYVEMLLDAGAKVMEEDVVGSTAFLFAASAGQLGLLKLRGADPSAYSNKQGVTALSLCIKGKSLECTKWLIEECHVDPHQRARARANPTMLMIAASVGALPIVKYLIETAKVNRADRNDNGSTALLYAAGGNEVRCLGYLLEAGAKLRERDDQDRTALLIAVGLGHRAAVEFLISRGADPNERSADGIDAVLAASGCCNVEVLRYLVEDLKLSLDTSNTLGHRPVHMAAGNGDVAGLRYLLDRMPEEVHVRCKTKTASGVLDAAVLEGSLECTRLLVARGASLTTTDSMGNTPAHVAAAGPNPACLALLLHAGAPHAALNASGDSIVEVALREGVAESVRVYYEFLMFKAAREGDTERVRYLHESHGVSRRHGRGRTHAEPSGDAPGRGGLRAWRRVIR